MTPESGLGLGYDEALRKLVAEHNISCERLTALQIADALKQALACGEFTRHVLEDGMSQRVTYVPYREFERLKSRIEWLEAIAAVADDLEWWMGQNLGDLGGAMGLSIKSNTEAGIGELCFLMNKLGESLHRYRLEKNKSRVAECDLDGTRWRDDA